MRTVLDLTLFYDSQLKELPAFSNFRSKIFVLGNSKPVPLEYNFVEVRLSPIHGNGLFATRDLPKGVIVTYHPVQAIIQSSSSVPGQDEITMYPYDEDFENKIQYGDYIYAYGCEVKWGNISRVIGNPRNISNSLLLGHMINDSAGNVFEGVGTDISSIKDALIKMGTSIEDKCNCKRIRCDEMGIIPIVTTREIKCGEELLEDYGFDWYRITNGESIGKKMEELMEVDRQFCLWLLDRFKKSADM